MAYHELSLPPGLPTDEVKLIRTQLEPHLEDVHTMLRLPIVGDAGLRAGCNFAIAQVLLSVVAGASVTLYEPRALSSRRDRGRLFKEILTKYYPWDAERRIPGALLDDDGAAKLYDLLRNPLAHSLGVIDSAESAAFARVEVLKGSFAEGDIVATERAVARPSDWLDPTLRQSGTDLTLWVRSLYWGVRRMIENVVATHATTTGGVTVTSPARIIEQRTT